MPFPTDPPAIESFFDPKNGVEKSRAPGGATVTRDKYLGRRTGVHRLVWRGKPTTFLDGILADYDSRPGEFSYGGDTVEYTERPRFEHRTDMPAGFFDVFCDLVVKPAGI